MRHGVLIRTDVCFYPVEHSADRPCLIPYPSQRWLSTRYIVGTSFHIIGPERLSLSSVSLFRSRLYSSLSFVLFLICSLSFNMLPLILTNSLLFATSLAIPTTRSFKRDSVQYNNTGNQPVNTVEVNPPTPSPKPYGGSNGHEYHSPAWIPVSSSEMLFRDTFKTC
jgi:hypothetical protein